MAKRFVFPIVLAISIIILISCQHKPKTAKDVLSRIAIIDRIKQIENDTLFQST